MAKSEDQCGREVLETVPTVMRFIRTQMRSHRSLDLSVPQFRALVFIERTHEASLGEVAENLGLTPPSASVLIDGLQGRGMVTRGDCPDDRRRLTLNITAPGSQALAQSRAEAQKSLSAILAGLNAQEIGDVTRAMRALHRVFADPSRTAGAAATRGPAERRSTANGNS